MARASGSRVQPAGFYLSDPSGMVSRADQDRIDAALGSSAHVSVERGFHRDDFLAWLALAVPGIPLVAAALSALAVRPSPALTRRAT